MQLIHSHQVTPASLPPAIGPALQAVSTADLRSWVQQLAFPRHFIAEPARNRATADWLIQTLRSFGYNVQVQGDSRNILSQKLPSTPPQIIVGAHYDSVPGSPGADDNASALAALLGCARAVATLSIALPIQFLAFNREEDGFLGSHEFVESFFAGHNPRQDHRSITCVHILEMVGFASTAPNSQHLPTGLPIKLRDTGDFLGLLANDQSAPSMHQALSAARAAVPDLPVTGLNVPPGAEFAFPVLARSDHVPFWAREIPALMWTDTAEFRNPNYHRPTDTPDTLDYAFLHRVTTALAATVLSQLSSKD